ncbi:MAG TPA: hypothetical protein VNM14_06975 [Planctomycetota bacterium]|jgi:hypothetical protein|nr:hypothetical protein [Planctomycetota bacterium]
MLSLLIAAIFCLPPGDDDLIWVEGEAARTKEISPPHSWYTSIKKDLLSGGDWVSNFGDKDGIVVYDLAVKKAGTYTLWVRANPIAAALAWKIGDGEWKEVDFRGASDQVNLASDNRPDMRFLAWSKAGPVALQPGTTTITFKMHSGNSHHGGLDCFCLTTKSFTPNGARKPGEKLGLAEPGTWAFEPDEDEFSSNALLDLRSLNEKVAGESGFVQRTPAGDFALGNGQPVRFWAVNTSGPPGDADALKKHARFLAKRGVNMVRWHGSLAPKGDKSKITDVDVAEIEKVQRFVAAMKAEGIYTTFSPYWAVAVHAYPSWGLKGHPSGGMTGMLFWDEDLQAAYKSWLREFFTRKNPYGPPLAQEPALAIFQIQNEDSLLFWTIESVKGEERRRLSTKFGSWAAKKYGSIDKAKDAWAGTHADGDDFAAGVAGLMHMWEFSSDQKGGRLQRLADTLQFFSETMHAFNKDLSEFLRKDLGCKMLVNAGNWYTANNLLMLDAEHWSYTANDIIGINHYVTSGAHINPTEQHKTGWLVAQGDYYQDGSVLLNPRKLATNRKLVAGYPYMISECTWVPPMSYQAEAPFLTAAYSSLTGFDILYWFAMGQVGYDRTVNKWQVATPSFLGGFPAASLMFRKRFVKQADPVVHEERALNDIWTLRSTVIGEEESYDPNRSTGYLPKEVTLKGGVSPLAFLVGPVEVKYGGDPAKTTAIDLSKYIDEQKKVVTSATGELTFNHGDGWCTIDAPKAQGVTGFLSKTGSFPLKTVTIESKNEYATILAVPLDDRTLASSKSILVQVTTHCRPYHWKETATTFKDPGGKTSYEGKRIDDTGAEPWNQVATQAVISVKNGLLKKAIALDPNGMPAGELKTESKGGAFVVTLPPNALYVILQ